MIFQSIRIICFLALLPTSILFSQARFSAGFIGGMTATQYDGDSHAGYNKLGFTAGAFSLLSLNSNWKIGFEITYFQKGARKYPVPEKGDYNEYQLVLDYAEVPVFVKWEQKKIWMEGGLVAGFLVREKEVLNQLDITGQRPFGPVDIPFLLGAGWKLNEQWDAGIRYSYSILPVRPHASGAVHQFNRGEYNNTLCLRLRYTWNRKQSGE